MEDPSRSERRRALRGGKPRTKNTQRAKLPPESTEHTNLAGRHGGDPSPQQDASGWSVRATSPVQSGPPGRPGTECTVQREPCSGTSVLQSKVKALKEKRTAGKQGGPSPQDQGSPKAGRGKLLASEEGPSEDMVVNPQAQIRTYLTDSLLNGAEEVGDQWAISVTGPGTSQAKAPRGTDSEEESPRGSRISLQRFWTPPCTKQAPPGFPDSSVSKMRKEKGLASELWGKTCARRDLQLLLSAEDLETDRVARTPEDLQFVPTEVPCDGSAPTRRLWRAESWGSLGSAASTGSITSLPSLAERVERNRALLKEMLTAADQACNHEPGDAPAAETEETSGDSRGAGPLPNDPDRDSGISLLDSEGCRAFVPQQELVLSTRHEQAKQLLQRARMKARTSPLRASHHILPSAAGISPESEGRNQTQDVKQNSLQRNRDGHPSGNLSDSSSSESSCGRLNRGPSPSRVRFEDESARDAEVRYLERLQQRQKRALDSVILSLGQGPLVSKPDLSDYISGDLLRKQNGINKACKQQSCAQSPGRGHHETLKGSSTKTLSPVIREEGTCSSCGSYIVKSPANLNSDVCVKLISNELSGVCSVDQEELSPWANVLNCADIYKSINANYLAIANFHAK
ncbi:uncharacterized protein KIAA1614-like [Rhinatrema bivittatum]|uniref:uncharacterized protein KIAA1614-like n=1 Tax=Rhinatrema bivittatum TaxID=194408 RepID=UPI00112AECBD|nr:uncharacterized protein KIAA1614-like [Rhinatrema bivittatum]